MECPFSKKQQCQIPDSHNVTTQTSFQMKCTVEKKSVVDWLDLKRQYFVNKKRGKKHKCSIQNQKEDSFAMSNLCRRPFCPSLWLFSRGSALEIALQSATTLNNHQCIYEEGVHLKLCELHFILNGFLKSAAFFHQFSLYVWEWKSPLSWCNQRIQCGAFLSAFYLFNFFLRMNEKHYTRTIREVFSGFTVMISKSKQYARERLREEKQPLSTSDRQCVTPAAPRNVLLDFFKFITVDWRSNGDVRKQRPLGTCTTSFRFNTAICFRVPRNGNISA